jgi:hypothetical protein
MGTRSHFSGKATNQAPDWLSLAFAPRRGFFFLQLHSLITIEINAQVSGFVVREPKPKGLNFLSVRGQDNEMALTNVEVTNFYTFFVRPQNGRVLVNFE